jgi:hypothetical protein
MHNLAGSSNAQFHSNETSAFYSNESIADTGTVNPYALIQLAGRKRRSFRKTKGKKSKKMGKGKNTRSLRGRKSRKHRKSRHYKK